MNLRTVLLGLAPALLLNGAFIPAHADHFPAKTGTWWMFGAVSHMSGWVSDTRDSGTQRWEIFGMHTLESFPVQQRIMIKTTSAVYRRTATTLSGGPRTTGYDSIFTPPRITLDTFTLCGVEGVNGLWFQGDSCWSFVRNPADSIPQGRLVLTPERVRYGTGFIDAIKVDPSSGRSRHVDSTYYKTADGIGPVFKYHRSSPFLMDAFWSDSLWLTATNANASAVRTQHPISRRAGTASARLTPDGTVHLSLDAPCAGEVSVRMHLIDGRRLTSRQFQIQTPGMQTLRLDPNAQSANRVNKRFIILRITMPDGTTMTITPSMATSRQK